MLGRIEGQQLNLAKMRIANYCVELEQEAGAVDVVHVVSQINERFKLVPATETNRLATDVNQMYDCLTRQQITSIDRGSYWKWKASAILEAKAMLEQELRGLTK